MNNPIYNNFDNLFANTLLQVLNTDSSTNVTFSPESLEDEGFTIKIANAIWLDKDFKCKQEYIDEITKHFKSSLINVNFTDTIGTKTLLNKWTSENTNRKIKEIGIDIDKFTKVMTTDALYLNANWADSFDSCGEDSFLNSDGTTSIINMMNRTLSYADYTETETFQLIEIPYINDDYVMIVVLPRESFSINDIIKKGEWLSIETKSSTVNLTMPSFEIETKIEFHKVLKETGLNEIFEDGNKLPRISENPPLRVDKIIQQVYLSVKEEGTEAAAVTVSEMVVGCLPPKEEELIEMNINHSFAYAIKNKKSGNILFAGIVNKL